MQNAKHFLFFFFSLFLKVKTIHNLTDVDAKELQNIKIIFLFFMFLIPHAKQFSKVDRPGTIHLSKISLNITANFGTNLENCNSVKQDW